MADELITEEHKENIISHWRIPNEITFGNRVKVFATFRGTIKAGSLTLRLRDSLDKEYWFPDPGSYDNGTDRGQLSIDDYTYSNTWDFILTDDYKLQPGKCYAKVEVYEDTDKPERRHITSSDEKTLILKETT